MALGDKNSISLASRSPSWGAWIEIIMYSQHCRIIAVAPPRGERGLKFSMSFVYPPCKKVAPPRGERGLKCVEQQAAGKTGQSLPLVGSVD